MHMCAHAYLCTCICVHTVCTSVSHSPRAYCATILPLRPPLRQPSPQTNTTSLLIPSRHHPLNRLLGFVFRYTILFPLRLLGLLSCFAIFFALFFSVKAVMPAGHTKLAVEQRLIRFMCGGFVASWTGVIKFHGPRPIRGPGR